MTFLAKRGFLPPRARICYISGVTTRAEIEKAADALPREEQEALLRHLKKNLSFKVGSKLGQFPKPPDVPIEELRRIHDLIEAEFSRIES